MTKLQIAKDKVGGLSNTSKMPCYSWGIPTRYCRRGKELQKDKSSICGSCYAMSGAYLWKPVDNAYTRRYEAWRNLPREEWIDSMVTILNSSAVKKRGHFRWFDSGDVQSLSMLRDIVEICRQTPHIKHWVATREYQIHKDLLSSIDTIPNNLVIRQSNDKIDQLDRDNISEDVHQSVTISDRSVKLSKKQFTCPSLLQDGKCLDCRACWNPRVKTIAYVKH